MKTYIAVIHREKNNFGVSFPDFPGCVTATNKISEIRELTLDVLQLHIEEMGCDSEKIPEPTKFEQISKKYINEDVFYITVHIDLF
ncbi:MAG: hypothetical protein BV456_00625 [Thermoplasmata archaeon M8B2D]|nr:MAG: hypothetical protein BV456_00625 [Thermoplasmata archaeon M8B2D]